MTSLKHPLPILGALLALSTVCPTAVKAKEGSAVPLQTWPVDKVQGLAPLLRSADIAVIESQPNGRMKQISLFTLAAAPPAQVREVLLNAARYGEFARNFTISKVTPHPDGSFDHFYQLNYGLFTIDGTHRYFPQPADGSGAPPVEVLDAAPDQTPPLGALRHYRWEFYNVGGATVVAMYGYTDVWQSGGLAAKLLERVPQLEHGIALVSQAALVLAIKHRAEQLTSTRPPLPPPGGARYDAFLERGVVVLLRSQNDRLSEMTLIDRSLAQPGQFLEVAKQPAKWSSFIPTITHSEDSGQHDELPVVDLEQSLPLISFRTTYGERISANAVDMMGLSGDLRGGRMRIEALAGRGAPSQIVMRSSQQFDRASLVIRQLYKLEPLFEYGINIGLQLVVLRGLKGKAEQLLAIAPSSR